MNETLAFWHNGKLMFGDVLFSLGEFLAVSLLKDGGVGANVSIEQAWDRREFRRIMGLLGGTSHQPRPNGRPFR